MELVYLLGSIISNTATSILLSLLLLLRVLLRRLFSSLSSDYGDGITLYEGVVWHERRRPVHHSFEYKVRYALIDLDRSPQFPSSNHLSAHQARTVAATTGPVFLLTIPPSVGYEQNPLSVYYCYDDNDQDSSNGSLRKCISEVTNTPWGERVTFVFNPNSDTVAKSLHVSPFMDMQGTWKMKATAPGNELSVVISVEHPNFGNFFCATLRAQRVPSMKVPDHKLFFWLMPHKVAVWIYWHALKLWWKNVTFIQHPRYSNPTYREEAVSLDMNLNCCKPELFGTTSLCPINGKIVTPHEFRWTDAKWPWS
ncbi:uncharacterized protein LOC130814471 isoform X1 [Amaranthus tricolor]|uniref:uncharacterized protein LOC130814471 isoform X1 n=1 Tax=Amaranthus tricolor TaxID=29722 RepID=UPI00258BD5FF|nr:uncharacterized protein LOC130814471 isoform X1 [Amaranthus tricolor]XP_057536527.1 uncharacterized protein LOC130814471 isoform X1 [Amaranthus tricolor]